MAGIRIPGVGSGLDTDSIVNQLMAIEKKPVTLLQTKSDNLTTEANAWRDLNSRLLNLQARLTDLSATSLWNSRLASIADSTVATVTATSSAALGTHTMTTAMAQGTVWLAKQNLPDPDMAVGTSGTVVINSAGANNGKTFDVVATDSLRDIANKINSDATLGLHAEFVQVGFSFRLQVTSNTGAANDFSLSDQSGTVTQDLQIGATTGVKLQTAADYKVTIDGVTTTSTTSTFNNVLPGLNVTVLKSSATATNVTVGRDNDKIVKAAKDFVDQYNSVIDFMNTQTSYDADNKKAGTLFGDSLVGSIQSALDQRITTPVSGAPTAYQLLSQVGISMPKFNKDETLTRKLTFDETKFRAALADNPSAVTDLFTMNSGSSQGVAVRTQAWLNDYTRTGGLVLGHADSLDKEKKGIDDQIKVWNTVILPMKEERLRKQFNDLDAAMASLQNQGTWLEQQLAALSGGSTTKK